MTIPCPYGCGGHIIREAVPDAVTGEPPHRNYCSHCAREQTEGRMQELVRQAEQRRETAAIRARTPISAGGVKVVPVPAPARTGQKPRNGWPMNRRARSEELRGLGPEIFEYSLTHRLKETCAHFGMSSRAWYDHRFGWEAAYKLKETCAMSARLAITNPPTLAKQVHQAVGDIMDDVAKLTRLLKDAGIDNEGD